MKKKEIKKQAKEIEKALVRAAKRLEKFPLGLVDASIFEVENVSLDRGMLEGVASGLTRLKELGERVERETNEIELLLVQLKHARRISEDARKTQKKLARAAKREALKAEKSLKGQVRSARKAEAKALKDHSEAV